MTDKEKDTSQTLRERAEAQLRAATAEKPPKVLSLAETNHLLHDLQVHQVELEIQNEELQSSQVKLAALLERYQDLYDLAPVSYLTLSDQGLILTANLTAASLLGVVRTKLVQQPLSRFIVAEEQTAYYLQRKKLLGATTPQGWEMQMVRADGSLFWAHLQATLIKDGRCQITFNDITARKQTEKQLLAAKEEWEKTFDAIPDLVTIQDKDMRIVRANRATHDLFQAEYGELNGKHCYELFGPGSEPCPECPLLDTLQDTDHHTATVQHDQVGTIWQISAAPILDENKTLQYLVHIARDITEQRKQEELLAQLSAKKEGLKRFESLKTMAGAIAHRFNNAMMAVQGNLEQILLTLPPSAIASGMAADASRAARGASEIGTMLLSYLGQRHLELRECALADFVTTCSPAFKKLGHPDISLEIIPPEQPLYCAMDRQHIQEVIDNIIANAVESLEDGEGTIEISFGTEQYTVDQFPLPFQDDDTRDGVYAYCQVKDNGPGISAEDLQRIFEPFYTTKFVGRGLGLAVTVGIMLRHHGAVLVESTPGSGTTVRILLPLISPPKQAKVSAGSVQRETYMPLSGHILFADDDEMILELGTKMLEHFGFTVHAAVNGQEAVDQVKKQDIDFCAVILDICMPVMDGIEALKLIRAIEPELPILLSSGYSENNLSLLKDQDVSPDYFINKPYTMDDLHQVLAELLS